MLISKIESVKHSRLLFIPILIILLVTPFRVTAQNVGIGTTTPQAKLDIHGGIRAGGTSKFLLYDSLTGKFTWNNSYLFIPSAQYIIQHSASGEGLYYSNAQLEYRYEDGTPRFFTNWNNGNGYFYGRLGIGTTTPLAKLHVADSAVVFSADVQLIVPAPDVPISGPGRRMMWYPGKAAFRVGYVNGTNWDTDSIGYHSFATGFNTVASGIYSAALGFEASARGVDSRAMGSFSIAKGDVSLAIGSYALATGSFSTAIGEAPTANGYASTALGSFTKATGDFSTAIGSSTYAGAQFALAAGSGDTASGYASRAMGYQTKALGEHSTAMGYQSKAVGSASLAIGNSTAAIGPSSIALGHESGAFGSGAAAIGFKDTASGWASIALGGYTAASGEFSTTMGAYTKATREFATAMNYATIANGHSSTSMGFYTTANADHSLSIGSFNDDTDLPGTFLATDRVFQIGNGFNQFNRSNAFTVLRNGNTGIGLAKTSAKLQVAEGNVVFSAAGNIPVIFDTIPVSGPGRRMLWYADKAAFRVGYIDGTQWDKDSMGTYSFASGLNSKAKGAISIAMGEGAIASGDLSTAMGWNTNASGLLSTAMGEGAFASGQASTATGFHTTASAVNSTAMGFLTTASASNSTAMGVRTIAKGYSSAVVGMFNDSILTANETSITPLTPLFIIGNGNGNTTRSNAMTVLKNGNTGIGTSSPTGTLDVIRGTAGGGTAVFRGTNFISHFNFGTTEDTYIRGGKNGSHVIINDLAGSGNVGIGTDIPSQKLHVVGSICYTGGIAGCSDIRYKKDFAPITSSLRSILSLNGFYYSWKQNEFPQMEFSDKRQIGFSAQEIEKLFPELVMTDNNGYKSVDYGRLTPVLVEAMKEQQQQINKQQQEIDELKNDRYLMKEQIKDLKTMIEKMIKQ